MSVLSQNPGKQTAREDWRSGEETAAPQGYLKWKSLIHEPFYYASNVVSVITSSF